MDNSDPPLGDNHPQDHSAAAGQSAGSQPPAAGGMASIERAFLRLTFWQTLLSLVGVFVGAVALYAALNESQAVREQTAAAVWPYVQMMMSDSDNGSQAHFALTFKNVGVGPARMRGMALTVGNEPVLSWDQAATRLRGEELRVGVDYGRSSVSRLVIAPGESVVAFQTDDRELALAMQESVYGGSVQLRYCFCSIFEQCWLSGVSDDTLALELESVESCPDFGAAAFRD
jgi:hypothetical protein